MTITSKRVFDIVAATLLGIVLSPLILAICVLLKITTPGPVLFRQRRLGFAGSTFLMNKFRKFPVGWGAQGPGVTVHMDSRMTGVGQFLERTKFDEIPQLLNILRGEMSFVGPRPESLRFQHLFTDGYEEILQYVPGIFGPNQTKYRNESLMYPANEDPEEYYERVLFPAKAENDLEYFGRASFLKDIGCIISGVCSIVFSLVVWRKSMKASLVLLVWDICSVLAAWVLTHWLKYSFVARSAIRPHVVEVFYTGLVVAPLLLMLIFSVTRVYRHPIRYFSETDCFRLIGASCAVWILTAVTFGSLFNSTSSLSLSVASILSIAFMVFPRVVYSRFFEVLPLVKSRSSLPNKVNTVVCGISQQAIELSSLLKLGFERTRLVGFVVENKDHLGRQINGCNVVGLVSDFDSLHHRFKLDQVWISDAVALKSRRKIQNWCEQHGVQSVALTELPGFKALSSEPVVTGAEGTASSAPRVPRPAINLGSKTKGKTPEVAA